VSTSNQQWSGILIALVDSGLGRLARHREDLEARLLGFLEAHRELVAGLPANSCGPSTLDDFIAEYRRNPQRVRAVFQALAYGCTARVAAVVWMTHFGATIDEIEYSYRRKDKTRLLLVVSPSKGSPPLRIDSNEHLDTTVLRLASVSKANGLPVIDAFYPLGLADVRAPRLDNWSIKVLEWVRRNGGHSAFCPSLIDASHVSDVALALVDLATADHIESKGTILGQVRQDPSLRANALRELSKDTATTASITKSGRRALREARFESQLAGASKDTLGMVLAEINRVLASEQGERERDEIEELEDERAAIEAILADGQEPRRQ
jgi:hypothetical protein